MISGEIIFFPLLSFITFILCYVASSIIINKLGSEGENDYDSYFLNVRDVVNNYSLMDETWLNQFVTVQFDNLNLTTSQVYYIDLIDPNTVGENSIVTIYNNPGSLNDPSYSVVQVNFSTEVPCPYNYVFDEPNFRCAFCQEGYTFVPADNNCQKEGSNSTTPIFAPPDYLQISLGSGQGVTLINSTYIPFGGFTQKGGNIRFDYTPKELRKRKWKVLNYIQPKCKDLCGSIYNATTNCGSNNQCPNFYFSPGDPPTSNPNSLDDKAHSFNCNYQQCTCAQGHILPFCQLLA